MKQILVTISCLIFFSNCQPDITTTELDEYIEVYESYDSTSHTSALDQIESALQHSESLETDIKFTQETKSKLQSENSKLKTELRQVKDSLDITKNELLQIKVKSAPKQNFIQRVFSIHTDSVETIVTDSVTYE
jgi:chromosome segregation ATPase